MVSLVTGAAGFLGRKLVRALLDNGHEVRGVVRSESQQESCGQQMTWIVCDLSKETLSPWDIKGVDVVFHLAATIRSDDERQFLLDNEYGTINLLRSCDGYVNKIIFASSQVVYGDVNSLVVDESFPLTGTDTAYSCSKINCENWLDWYRKKADRRVVSLRFTGFIEDGSVVNYFLDCALRGLPIELFSRGDVCRDYLCANDGIQSLLLSAQFKETAGQAESFNIGSGQAISTYDLARIVCEETGSDSKIVRLDRLAPKSNFVYNISKAKQILNFYPANLEIAVRSYIREEIVRKRNV